MGSNWPDWPESEMIPASTHLFFRCDAGRMCCHHRPEHENTRRQVRTTDLRPNRRIKQTGQPRTSPDVHRSCGRNSIRPGVSWFLECVSQPSGLLPNDDSTAITIALVEFFEVYNQSVKPTSLQKVLNLIQHEYRLIVENSIAGQTNHVCDRSCDQWTV
jgi:hypothetical protein